MYGTLVDLLPPTSIDFCLEVHLSSNEVSDMLIVRVNTIELYSIVTVEEENRIKLLSRHPLASRIIDITRIPHTAGGFDRILLAFPDSYYSIITWNRATYEWNTFSLHSFNRPECQTVLMETTLEVFGDRRKMAVDNEARCALVRVNETRLAILPLDQNLRSRMIEFSLLDEKIRNVIDFCFLPGYMEPTMAILYEPTMTWPYRYPILKETLCLIVCTIDFRREIPSFTQIASYTGLATDARKLWCTSASFAGRGLVVYGANTLVHIEPGNPTISAVALNSYVNSKMNGLRRNIALRTSFENATFIELDNHLLASSDSGELFRCQVIKEGGNRRIDIVSVRSMLGDISVKKMAMFGNQVFLVVPILGDAVFIDFASSHNLTDNIMVNNIPTGNIDDIDDIYNESSQSSVIAEPSSKTYRKLASLPVFAPLSDFCIGGSSQGGDLEIFTCCGSMDKGRVVIFRNHLPLLYTTPFNISNSQSVFDVGPNLYLISTENSSLVLSTKNNVKEISTAILTSCTIYAGNVGELVIQVANTIRILSADLSTVIAEGEFNSYSRANRAMAIDSYIIVSHEDGQITMCQFSNSTITFLNWQSADPIVTWDLFEYNGTTIFAYIGSDGELFLVDLRERNCIFKNSLFGALPVIASTTEEVDHGLTFDADQSITNVIFIKNQFGDLLTIVSSNSIGIVIYRKINDSFIRVPMSSFGTSMCSLPTNGDISLHRTKLDSEDVVVAIGPNNTWLITCTIFGYPVIHPIRLSSKILSVSSNEFGIFDQSGSYQRIAVKQNWKFDHAMPYLATDFDETIRFAVYHSPSSTYGIVCNKLVDFVLPRDEYTLISDNEITLPPDAIPPKQSTYSVKLLSPRTWTVIDEFSLNEDEYALCLASATLDTKQTASGRQPFIIVGTSTCRGEDRPARGRVLVFDVISIVPEIERPEMDRRLKLLASEEMKGPVNALTHLNGALLVSVGSKVIIHTFENNDSLTGVAFVDTGVYGNTVASLRNFFVIGDICKSLAFHAFQEKPPKLIVLARDFADRPILAVEFLLDTNGDVLIIAADNLGNAHLFVYDPTAAASEGGLRLINKGSIRLGDDILKMRRIVLSKGVHACLIAAESGMISCLAPIEENQFRSLYGLQLRLVAALPHSGGMSPRMSRQSSPLLNRHEPGPRNILDLTSVGIMRLADLPIPARDHLIENMLGNQVNSMTNTVSDVIRSIVSLFT